MLKFWPFVGTDFVIFIINFENHSSICSVWLILTSTKFLQNQLFFEVNESSKIWYDYWTSPNGYNSKSIFKLYDKLELIYDPERWSPTYHRECPEEVLKMLYAHVQPRLVVQTWLPYFLRNTTEDEAVQQMRNWLKIAHNIKSQHTMGPRYALFLSVFCEIKHFHRFLLDFLKS